jgi:signal transduction histidine kinase
MQERVEMLGGRFSVVSEPGRGLRVEAHLPLLERAA